VRLGDGIARDLVPGDVIGRSDTAALVIDDPRVSEAHAFISLRRGSLYLLSLRRMVAVDGCQANEVLLARHIIVEFAPGLYLTIEDVVSPDRVIGVEAEGLTARPLAQVSSIYGAPRPSIVSRFEPAAPAHMWLVGDKPKLAHAGQEPRWVEQGTCFVVQECEFHLVSMSMSSVHNPTTAVEGSLLTPIEIVASFDTVEIRRKSHPSVTFGGQSARILSELVAVAGPVSWRGLAQELWPQPAVDVELRRRWDAALSRLRRKLRDCDIRADLIVADGSGNMRLCLRDGDVARDEG